MYQYRKITEFGFRGMWRIMQISEAVLSTSADNISSIQLTYIIHQVILNLIHKT